VGGKGSCWQRDCGVVFFFFMNGEGHYGQVKGLQPREG